MSTNTSADNDKDPFIASLETEIFGSGPVATPASRRPESGVTVIPTTTQGEVDSFTHERETEARMMEERAQRVLDGLGLVVEKPGTSLREAGVLINDEAGPDAVEISEKQFREMIDVLMAPCTKDNVLLARQKQAIFTRMTLLPLAKLHKHVDYTPKEVRMLLVSNQCARLGSGPFGEGSGYIPPIYASYLSGEPLEMSGETEYQAVITSGLGESAFRDPELKNVNERMERLVEQEPIPGTTLVTLTQQFGQLPTRK